MQILLSKARLPFTDGPTDGRTISCMLTSGEGRNIHRTGGQGLLTPFHTPPRCTYPLSEKKKKKTGKKHLKRSNFYFLTLAYRRTVGRMNKASATKKKKTWIGHNYDVNIQPAGTGDFLLSNPNHFSDLNASRSDQSP